MASKPLTPGTYGRAEPWRVRMVAQADARKAGEIRAQEHGRQMARGAAVWGAIGATFMAAAITTALLAS